MNFQSVHWDGGWTIASGCVERTFTLSKPEEGQLLPRYRVQIQGFIGGIEELYLGLLDVDRAIESDVHEMLGRIAQEGRTIFTISIEYEGNPSQYVISVERDPRDLMPEAGGWPAEIESLTDLQKQLNEGKDKACIPKDAVSTQDCRGTEYGRISTAKPSEVDLKPGQSILQGVETGRISSEHPNPGARPKLLVERDPGQGKKEEGSD